MKNPSLFAISIAATLGTSLILTFAQLPCIQTCLIALCLSLLLTVISYFFLSKLQIIFLFISTSLIAFTWADYSAHTLLKQRLPAALEGQALNVIMTITAPPETHGFVTHIDATLQKIISPLNISWQLPVKIRLSCYQTPCEVDVGDTVQAVVKFRAPRSTYNPASFDYEAWLFAHRYSATAYLQTHSQLQQLPSSFARPNHWLEYLRQYLDHAIQISLPNNYYQGLISALTVGERSQMGNSQWQVLQATGTNHLFAIAGLHIGMVSFISYFLGHFLWRRSRYLPLYLPAKQAGLISAMLAALFYSALAGFAIPTQRAISMTFVILLTALNKKILSPWQIYALALLGLLIINPLNILLDSFWLSFTAVAIILYGHLGRRHHKHLLQHLHSQYLVMIGLLPLTLWFFHRFGWLGLIANCIAIPWILFFTMPCCLLGALCWPISHILSKLCWLAASFSLQLLWPILKFLAHFKFLQWQFYGEHIWQLLLAMLGAIIIFMPRGLPGRWLGIIFTLPMLCYQAEQPLQQGEIWLQLLDVGQGLSAMVRTQHHTLVFDTGAALPGSIDMGESVVVPALLAADRRKLDALVISHPDNDHSGGAAAIWQEINIQQIFTSTPQFMMQKLSSIKKSLPPIITCQTRQNWQWDGVQFEFIYPSKDSTGKDNDRSCVLRISNHHQSILLPGDIEKYSENYLLDHEANKLSSTTLIAPHHGSKTSSTENFVNAVHPQWVLYPIGYRNKFHFPHESVIARYQMIHATQFNTAQDGQIILKFSDSNNPPKIILTRQAQAKFWRY